MIAFDHARRHREVEIDRGDNQTCHSSTYKKLTMVHGNTKIRGSDRAGINNQSL